MNEPTPDLEALLFDAAAGDLSPDDAERLRAAIEADPSIARLLDEQRSMAAEVAATPMTGLERARLHRAVSGAIAPTPARPVSWHRWAFAVAAVVVVVVAGGFALFGGELGGTFGDISAEVASAPAADTDSAGAGDFAGGADESEEAARAEGEAATGLAPEVGDDTADAAAGDGSVAFPACPGTVEPGDEPTVGWSTPEDALAGLDDVPGGSMPPGGEPVLEVSGDVAVISWFDEGRLVQQVELTLTDEWHVSGRISCTP